MNPILEDAIKKFLEHGYLVTKKQAAKLSGISEGRITQKISEGKLITVKIADLEMIRLKDITEK